MSFLNLSVNKSGFNFFPVITFDHPLDKMVTPHLHHVAKAALISYPYAVNANLEDLLLPLLIDSGSFGLLKYGGEINESNLDVSITLNMKGEKLTITPVKLLEFQEKHGAGGFTLDIPVNLSMNIDIKRARFEMSMKNAIRALLSRRKKDFILFGSLPAIDDLVLFAKGVKELIARGIDGIAIGSLIPHRNNKEYIKDIIKLTSEISGPRPLHIFGTGTVTAMTEQSSYGATSFDSSSYIREALRGKCSVKGFKRVETPSLIESMHLALLSIAHLNMAPLPLSSFPMFHSSLIEPAEKTL